MKAAHFVGLVLATFCLSTASADIVEFRQGQNLTGTATPYSGVEDTFLNNNSTPSAASSGTTGYVQASNAHQTLFRFNNIISPSGVTAGLVPEAVFSGPSTNLPGGTSQFVTTIDSATLSLFRPNTAATAAGNWNLHQILVDWNQDTSGTARTNTMNFLTLNSDGGKGYVTLDDIEGASTPFATENAVVGGYTNFDVTQQIQDVLAGNLDALDFAVFGVTSRIAMSSTGTLTERPFLSIEFSVLEIPPLTPEPGSLVLWGMVGLGMTAAGWRRWRQKRQAA